MKLTAYQHNGLNLLIREGRSNAAERDIIREVQREYPWDFPIHTAIDIGAHVGSWTCYAKRLYPDARIVACEVDPETFQILEFNANGLEDVTLVHGRAGYDDEPHIIWRHSANSGSTSTWRTSDKDKARFNDPNGTSLPAPPCVGLGQLMNMGGFDRVDVLKLDCEGAEIDILCHAQDDVLMRIDRVIGEIHTTPHEFEDQTNWRLQKMGFQVSYREHPGDPSLFYLHAWREGRLS
jgi:FkbM family methyltransferase